MNPRLRILLLSLAALLGMALALPARADPPGRAGRISWLAGNVFLRGADGGETRAASLNWPVTGGDEIVTDPGARAEIRLGATSLRLDEDTEVRITRLDDERFDVQLLEGSVGVRIGSREGAGEFSLITPDGRMLAEGPGRYRVDSDDRSSYFTAYRGSLRFDSQDASERIPEGERLEAWYSDGTRFQWSAPQEDEFASWNLARDERDERLGTPAHVSPAMTGYEDLAAYGDWQEAPEYGPVWYPRGIPHDWAPYRHGRWVWVSPWGWTWVDDAPWGFAPFHYGRWVWLAGRWAWVPGHYEPRPVYAPALVAWVGSPGWSVGIGSAAVPAVGWFPLGPREVFVPFYRCSPAHVRRVNITHVREVTVINRVVEAPHRARYMHRQRTGAVTVVPREALTAGRPVARVALRDSARLAREAEVRPALPAAIARPPRAEERRRDRDEDRARRPGRESPAMVRPAEDPRRERQDSRPERGAEARRDAERRRERLEVQRRDEAREALPAVPGEAPRRRFGPEREPERPALQRPEREAEPGPGRDRRDAVERRIPGRDPREATDRRIPGRDPREATDRRGPGRDPRDAAERSAPGREPREAAERPRPGPAPRERTAPGPRGEPPAVREEAPRGTPPTVRALPNDRALQERLEANRQEQALRRQQQEESQALRRQQQAREEQERAAALRERRAADEARRQQQEVRQQERERREADTLRRQQADAQRQAAEARRQQMEAQRRAEGERARQQADRVRAEQAERARTRREAGQTEGRGAEGRPALRARPAEPRAEPRGRPEPRGRELPRPPGAEQKR